MLDAQERHRQPFDPRNWRRRPLRERWDPQQPDMATEYKQWVFPRHSITRFMIAVQALCEWMYGSAHDRRTIPGRRVAEDLSSEVEQLLDPSLDDEEIEPLMASFQERLRKGDRTLAEALEFAATHRDSGLALETLAATRAPAFIDNVYRAIKSGLCSGVTEVRFAAVAALPDLPLARQRELRRLLETRSGQEESDESVRRAAGHLLRRIGD